MLLNSRNWVPPPSKNSKFIKISKKSYQTTTFLKPKNQLFLNFKHYSKPLKNATHSTTVTQKHANKKAIQSKLATKNPPFNVHTLFPQPTRNSPLKHMQIWKFLRVSLAPPCAVFCAYIFCSRPPAVKNNSSMGTRKATNVGKFKLVFVRDWLDWGVG